LADGNIEYTTGKTGRNMRERTWGGKLTENVVQAISGDLLAEAMFFLQVMGYEIVMTVHDEVVIYAPEPTEFDIGIVTDVMETLPTWADGCPVKAETEILEFYK